MARRVYGLRAFAIDKYEEDGSAETMAGEVIKGTFYQVVRGGRVFDTLIDSYAEAKRERDRHNAAESKWWSLSEPQREALRACDRRHIVDHEIRFMRYVGTSVEEIISQGLDPDRMDMR